MAYFGWKRGLQGIPSIEAIVNPESKDTFQFLGGGTAGNGKGIPPEVRGSLFPGLKQGDPKRL